MSLFARPSVALAIVFGCLVVLIPRILLPYFRPRPVYGTEDPFRRSSSPINQQHHHTIIDPVTESTTSGHNVYSDMPIDHSDTDLRANELVLKPGSTFVLPMYAVGIAVFVIYTCFKYMGGRKSQEDLIRSRYSPTNIQWNAQKKEFKYQPNKRQAFDDDDEQEDDSYAGLDADYVEYLKQKRREERERDQTITTDQKQMHNTLDEMKHSLSFISSKLGTNTTKSTLTNNEITQLQDRLAATEAQMYKILNALDAASNQMNEITRGSRQSLEQPVQVNSRERRDDYEYDEDYHQSSRSLSDSEEEEEEEEEQNENEKEDDAEEEGSSSYEEDEEVSNEEEEDDESESESESDRYGGLMHTDYARDPSSIDDYDLDETRKPEETADSQTKVQEWRERNHSQSLSSNNSSVGEDQAIPKEGEGNHLRQRKHQEDNE